MTTIYRVACRQENDMKDIIKSKKRKHNKITAGNEAAQSDGRWDGIKS